MNDIFKFVRDNIDIYDIGRFYEFDIYDLGLYYYQGICPIDPCRKNLKGFLIISLQKKLFYCFECGFSGDCITIGEKMYNISYSKSAVNLIESMELNIPKSLYEQFIKLCEDANQQSFGKSYLADLIRYKKAALKIDNVKIELTLDRDSNIITWPPYVWLISEYFSEVRNIDHKEINNRFKDYIKNINDPSKEEYTEVRKLFEE